MAKIDKLLHFLSHSFNMEISDLVINECRSAMLIPTMDISCLMVYSEQIEDKKVKNIDRELKKTRPKMGILPRLDLKCKISQDLRRIFPTKAHLTLKRSSKVKCLCPSLNKEEVVVLLLRSVLELSMIENMKANV